MPPAEKLYAKVLSLEAEVTDLRAQVAWFQRQMFAGGRSEKTADRIARANKTWAA